MPSNLIMERNMHNLGSLQFVPSFQAQENPMTVNWLSCLHFHIPRPIGLLLEVICNALLRDLELSGTQAAACQVGRA